MMVPKYANLLKPFHQKYVICNKNKMALYRNNYLSTFRNKCGTQLETIKTIAKTI